MQARLMPMAYLVAVLFDLHGPGSTTTAAAAAALSGRVSRLRYQDMSYKNFSPAE